jgi:ABC-2 type transport system ATP-binding protein
VIECQNVKKIINGVEILKGISFRVSEFKTLGVLGPNGAGKSTTLKIIATLLKPSSGTLTISDHDIYTSSDSIRPLIGYLPEFLNLYPELTVSEYLELFAILKGVKKNNLKFQIESNLEKCRLKDVANKSCGVLSKGFRQKVGLATALIGDSKLLLLDEPTSGLDPREIVEIRALIANLKSTHTILFSSHVLSEVSELCDEVVIFINGKTAVQTSLSKIEMKNNLENTFLNALNGNGRVNV